MKKIALLGISLLLTSLSQAGAQAATAVPQFDLQKFVGTWYEVLRYPDKAEKKCVQEPTVLYALADKPARFSVVRTCSTKDGFINVQNLDGRKANKTGDGALKVKTIWPFSRKYSVLALGPNYEWAVLGSRNHKSLWALSREPSPDSQTLEAIKARVTAEGFSVGKLMTTPKS